jgi:hypothetical protein
MTVEQGLRGGVQLEPERAIVTSGSGAKVSRSVSVWPARVLLIETAITELAILAFRQ